MYGNLQDIDLCSLLHFIESKQKSGVLFVEKKSISSYEDADFYFIFFYAGKIVYGGDQQSFDLERLKDYLSYYNLDDKLKEIETELMSSASIAEYEGLLLLSEKQIISYEKQKNILTKIIQETLFETLSLSQGFFTLNFYHFLQPQINTFPIDQFLSSTFISLRKWKQSYGYIQSVDQILSITEPLKLKTFFNNNTYQILSSKLNNKISLKQLSRNLHQDLGSIAQLIYPCIEKGWINVVNYHHQNNFLETKKDSYFNIVCLTNDQNWAINTRNLLTSEKYNFVTTINISQGLEHIFQITPNLILFALEDNNFSKYQFCKILRNTQSLSHIPIICIVNHFIFEENLRSKMSGATEYMTKNTFNKYLFNIIEKYNL